MKNKKWLFTLIIILIFIYIIISLLLSIPWNKKYKNTIFLGSITKVEVENNSIKVFDDNIKMNNRKVKLFFNDEFIDAYISSITGENSSVENIYKAYSISGENLVPELGIIAYTGDIPISIKKSNKNSSRDVNLILDFAKSNNINLSKNIELEYLFVNNFDIDNDGSEEYVYSTGFIDKGLDENTYYSVVFLKKNNNYILIDSENDSKNSDHVKFYFFNLIDFNNDNNYEFVVKEIYQEYGPEVYNIYNFNGTEFTKIGGE